MTTEELQSALSQREEQLRAALEKNERLELILDEARHDSARLNWLDLYRTTVHGTEIPLWEIEGIDSFEDQTIRQAIDRESKRLGHGDSEPILDPATQISRLYPGTQRPVNFT